MRNLTGTKCSYGPIYPATERADQSDHDSQLAEEVTDSDPTAPCDKVGGVEDDADPLDPVLVKEGNRVSDALNDGTYPADEQHQVVVLGKHGVYVHCGACHTAIALYWDSAKSVLVSTAYTKHYDRRHAKKSTSILSNQKVVSAYAIIYMLCNVCTTI